MPTQPTAPRGIMLVDKAQDWTSHDVVARTRRLAHTRRVGHAGTLDPMATGLLVLGLGQGTRLLTHLVGCTKTYEATIRLGIGTVTDDAEGETTSSQGAPLVDPAALVDGIVGLTGDILQVPAKVSAIKVNGTRSYAKVRAGDDVDLAARPVTVSQFDVTDIRMAIARLADGREIPVTDVDVVVECSAGTYIRALARDLGAFLGVGGHLTSLRRTSVGPFSVTEAATLETIDDGLEHHPGVVMSLAQCAARMFPVRAIDADEERRLRYGQAIDARDADGPLAAIDAAGELVALLDPARACTRSLIVFPHDV